MRKYLLAAAAVAAIATPAMARDGAGYFGIEGGILFPRDGNFDLTGTTTRTRVTTALPPVTTTTVTTSSFDNGFVNDYKKGLDIDAIVGYDFGMFRLEGELGYKRTKARDFAASPALLASLTTALGAPVTNADLVDVDATDRTTVLSGMINGLVDFGVSPGFSLYAGGGAGYARVKTFGAKDNAFAWQLIAGLSTAVSENVDLGVKYRYFQTAKLNYDTAFSDSFTDIGGTTTTSSTFGSRNKFRSHSLLASLIFNFGGNEPAPAPIVEAAPPPPPPPPATQTCPDGSVIDATAVCPPPPAPPPPPPPAQGERG